MVRHVDHPADAYDLVVAGAGPVGCVIAERAAALLGWSVLVVDTRAHIAGNCYDVRDADGLLLHPYGPHYFRTDRDDTLAYLSRFTAWIPGNYVVKASHGGELYPFPINLTTLERFFGVSLDAQAAAALLERERIPIAAPANSEEVVLSRVGRALYEAFYVGYTQKQWGRHPRELAPSVCGRIPVRLTRDERYVDHRHQVMPAAGYTAMFETMLADPRIDVLLGTDYFAIRDHVRPRHATVYTGPIDRYFDHALGPLPWRSLEFELRTFPQERVQPCVQINYPNEHAYTRSVEIKHVTGQHHPHTVVSYEYPRATGEPFYPVPSAESDERYRAYRALAERATADHAVYFVGRLAQYTYVNTDQAVELALAAFATITARFAPERGTGEPLWVVMPVYNEAACLRGVLDAWLPALREGSRDVTVLCIDDGSTDGTPEVLLAAARVHPELRILRQPNAGHGQACVAGYRAALAGGAAWILQIDSDGQCDPAFFAGFWRDRVRHPVQYGFRATRDDGLARVAVSRTLSHVVWAATGVRVRDANVPYRLMRADAVHPIVDGVPVDFYLANIAIAVLQERRFGIAWRDIAFRRRTAGRSTLGARTLVRHARRLRHDLARLA